jgi:hypothetical protein
MLNATICLPFAYHLRPLADVEKEAILEAIIQKGSMKEVAMGGCFYRVAGTQTSTKT